MVESYGDSMWYREASPYAHAASPSCYEKWQRRTYGSFFPVPLSTNFFSSQPTKHRTNLGNRRHNVARRLDDEALGFLPVRTESLGLTLRLVGTTISSEGKVLRPL